MAATETKKKTSAKKAEDTPTEEESNGRSSYKMTEEHKRKLEVGRQQSRAVKQYLELLASSSRGPRKQDRSVLERKLEKAHAAVESAPDPAEQLLAVQKRMDAEAALAEMDAMSDFEHAETEFVDSVKPWAESKGVTYAALREMGVPAAVLKRAGISRSR